ncbi:hypothetical protein GP486_007950 [Trichoglossum hirsutum]|uniref:Uncharacterized protein n=1 Tax=Trichoglossum hirsutum TaxID=265104 RepID=A0A9P8IAW3_9PEZI|nr:hypothetical protein GP486_007950 [Trichoglossum hirsutum]
MLGTDFYPVLPSSYGSQNKSRNSTLRTSSSTVHGSQGVAAPNPVDWTQGIKKPTSQSQSPRRGGGGQGASSTAPEQASHRKSSSTSSSSSQIVSYLQIPSTINDTESNSTPVPLTPLPNEAIPSKMMGFRKWVTTILSTTQVSQNVILLALMFIYRLKKLNPTVKGKPGSEFRLLTVALMLGNKFLDDNTYTNKTWAEVSGISVQEIHVMEVEFLSNMRYSLYTSEVEWREWQIKLGRFWSYFDKASKADITPKSSQSGGPVTPTLNIPPPLPSPPSSTHASPPFATTYSPGGSISNPPLIIPSQIPLAVPSPVVHMPPVDLRPTPRKRSYDDSAQEPAAKRVTRSMAQKYPASAGFQTRPPDFSGTPCPTGNMPRLPTPNLSITTPSSNGYGLPSFTQLPPPGGRAMALAFPGPMTWPQPTAVPPSSAPSQPNTHNITITPFGQPTRQQLLNPSSPITSSPTSSCFSAQGSSPNHLSPSFFLTNRNSPYRPVRRVSTLLVPPPPTSFNNVPQGLSFNQMHYQPLGKAKTECKTGVVPYMQTDPWPQPQSLHWPPLPQPNFHA